jgi:catechol 2,3-dioxygenase-like lactoylglutathione lyase family enzyme
MTEQLPKLRVARPTADIDALMPFYCNGLGFAVLAHFEDHAGFSGAILGRLGAPWHLEFTYCASELDHRAPSQDNLLALYLPVAEQWQEAVERMRAAGFAPVPSFNPYWDQQGLTFEDPDGYRTVLQHQAWPL